MGAAGETRPSQEAGSRGPGCRGRAGPQQPCGHPGSQIQTWGRMAAALHLPDEDIGLRDEKVPKAPSRADVHFPLHSTKPRAFPVILLTLKL